MNDMNEQPRQPAAPLTPQGDHGGQGPTGTMASTGGRAPIHYRSDNGKVTIIPNRCDPAALMAAFERVDSASTIARTAVAGSDEHRSRS